MERVYVIVIDDETSIRKTFKYMLQEEGYEVATAGTFQEGLETIRRREPDVIVTDIILGANSGVDLLREIRNQGFEVPVVMITGDPDLSTATDSLRLGAFDYLAKPVKRHRLLEVVFRALRHRNLLEERRRLSEERERARSQLQAVFDGVGEGLVLVDRRMRVREINRAALEMLEKTHEETLGKPLSEFLPNVVAHLRDSLERILLGEPHSDQATIDDPFGRGTRDVAHAKVSPSFTAEKERTGAVVVLRDITRLKNLEAHVLEKTGQFNLIGGSKPMQEIYQLVENLRETDTTVLIQGESGTGKELAAAALHYQGPRVTGPFVPVNCTALNEQLLESELFGHVKGAFTGAIANKVGRFEAAEDGTIFLDEIGDMSVKLQTKLLRVLQERTIERVGEARAQKVNVRVIAATNRDLDGMIRTGQFREDLYYRLNVVRIVMPSLRDKKEDIPLLAEHFRQKLIRRYKKPIEGFTDAALQWLLMYDWPGNVRELENAVEHAFIMCKSPLIDARDLPKIIHPAEDAQPAGPAPLPGNERERLIAALVRSGGNRSKAAQILGINRTTLYRRMERWNVSDPTKG